ncbi:hypothetical protein ACOSP7_007005 [Xanthoceras sorbifolium]
MIYITSQPTNFSDIRCDIPELKDEPSAIMDTSFVVDIALYEKWERSNRLRVMFIKTKIFDSIRGSVDQQDNVRDLLKGINEQFVTSEKTLASTLSLSLTSVKDVREHIIQMRDIAAQLNKLEVNMSESFHMNYILNTLPQQYGPFKISYNTHKDK